MGSLEGGCGGGVPCALTPRALPLLFLCRAYLECDSHDEIVRGPGPAAGNHVFAALFGTESVCAKCRDTRLAGRYTGLAIDFDA